MIDTLPWILALFQKRIAGDDSLLELARLRFQNAGLGVELQSGDSDELNRLLGFRPGPDVPAMTHLPRGMNLFMEENRVWICELAKEFAGRLDGFVVHDQRQIRGWFSDYLQLLRDLDGKLLDISDSPMLFVEYAAGLDPQFFYDFAASIQELEKISVCVDIGHLGIWQAKKKYKEFFPDQDICSLKPPDQQLSLRIEAVQEAVSSCLVQVSDWVGAIAALEKPLHFHLHDGHPLSTFSPYGVSDHLSFFSSIPLPFVFQGEQSLPLMYGPGGLKEIVRQASLYLDFDALSFSLEIHPAEEREKLGEYDYLFTHWQDKTNAEKMNGWLSTLLANHKLLQKICLHINE